MSWLTLAIDGLSLVCQLTAAVLALRLIRVTGKSKAWCMISVALLLMSLRRLLPFIGLSTLRVPVITTSDWLNELAGLCAAIFLLIGIAAIAPLFRAVHSAKEQLTMSRNELERQVQARTADLARINAEVREEQRHLRQILEMYERDRQLTACEIHDGFVQQATGALMNLQAYRALPERDPERAREILDQAMCSLEAGISEARGLISGLRPTILDDFGVLAAIDHLVSEARAHSGIEIEWSHDVQFDRVAPPLETALFRIMQESLSNALRHSGTSRICIQLNQEQDGVRATVRDWGRGFDPSTNKPNHFGLQGIRERARVLGGEAVIRSGPGLGTTVSALFPELKFEKATPPGGIARLAVRTDPHESQPAAGPSASAAPGA